MKNTDIALLIIRIALGVVFITHGLVKFNVIGGGVGIAGFSSILEGLGIPFPHVMAYVVPLCEVGGGFLVAAGLFSRIAALALFGIMVVALLKVHWVNGFFLGSQGSGHGFEYVMVLGAMSFAIVVAGAGHLSIQRLLKGEKRRYN